MMELQVVLSSDEIIRGLKHYRRIAKQDILRAPESANPATAQRHAEARREVYAALTETAEQTTPQAVVEAALGMYRALPFGNDSDDLEQVALRGRENALENFFLMVGLEPKLRREARNQRPTMVAAVESDGSRAQ
jgi:hypothetical protein